MLGKARHEIVASSFIYGPQCLTKITAMVLGEAGVNADGRLELDGFYSALQDASPD